MSEDLAKLFSLSGRVALVTGASRGIGHALADGLAAAGAQTIGIARSAAAVPYQHSVTYSVADVRKGVEPVIEDLIAHYGALDILVNAAGISLASDAQPNALLAFDRTLETNLRSAYAVCLAAATVMRPGSSIINVTSIGAHAGFPDNPGYVAAKGGLRSLTQALAVDLGPRGIRVNALAPGYIRTEMTSASHADPQLHEARRRHTCLGRWGEPDDLVGGCVFLASGASAFMTGQSLIIDGGWIAKGLT